MFAISISAVVPRPEHRMPGDGRRRHSGLQHRLTQISLKPPLPGGRRLCSDSGPSFVEADVAVCLN